MVSFNMICFNIFFAIIYFFVSKLVGLFESIASIENYIFGRKVSKINLRIIYDYKLLKPKILRQNAQWRSWISWEVSFPATEDVYVKKWKIINVGDTE